MQPKHERYKIIRKIKKEHERERKRNIHRLKNVPIIIHLLELIQFIKSQESSLYSLQFIVFRLYWHYEFIVHQVVLFTVRMFDVRYNSEF